MARLLVLLFAVVAVTYALKYAPVPMNAAYDSLPALRDEIAEKVNALNAGWTASVDANSRSSIGGKTIGEVKRMLGAKKGGPQLPPRTDFAISADALPSSFDSRQQWPECPSINTIRDQSACGSCWAFGAVEAMSDRSCIVLKQNISLSTQDMAFCCSTCGEGCDGGYPSAAWEYWVHNGVATNSCSPYSLPSCDHHLPNSSNPCPTNEYPSPACKKTCQDGETWATSLHYGARAYSVSGAQAMMQDLVTNGPIETAFDVYEDFLTYTGGVYKHTTGEFLGGHAVKIIGYGVLNGQNYWLVANSWNPDWGLKGYFMILRGVNECGFESSASAGEPKN
jgi:cathepsin B